MSTVHILYTELEVHIPYSGSLKEKRRVVNRLRDRARQQFNLSLAEVGYLEEWQRAGIAIVMLGNERPGLERQLSQLESYLGEVVDAELVWLGRQWL
ncbi:MAG: DUF503 domain-containing protein [Pseudomonadota bacterium]|nr:DUF503 domain-containing protein [Pseudomonadota bacterium]